MYYSFQNIRMNREREDDQYEMQGNHEKNHDRFSVSSNASAVAVSCDTCGDFVAKCGGNSRGGNSRAGNGAGYFGFGK